MEKVRIDQELFFQSRLFGWHLHKLFPERAINEFSHPVAIFVELKMEVGHLRQHSERRFSAKSGFHTKNAIIPSLFGNSTFS